MGKLDRIIGIDYGRKRTGLAVSDPLGVFASALDTVQTAKLLDYLKNYAETNPVGLFVVGWPVNMDGKPSEAAADVRVCLKNLGKAFPDIPVETADERFTSVLAHRAMIEGGMKYSRRRDKSSVDKISAALILQGYLDRRNRGEGQGTDAADIPCAQVPQPADRDAEGPISPRPKKRKFPTKAHGS